MRFCRSTLHLRAHSVPVTRVGRARRPPVAASAHVAPGATRGPGGVRARRAPGAVCLGGVDDMPILVARACAGHHRIPRFLLFGPFCLVGAGWLAVHSPSREVTIAFNAGPVRLAVTLCESCPHRGEKGGMKSAR